MKNYLIRDCAKARQVLANLKREYTELGSYLLLSLSDDELAKVKDAGLEIWDDDTGEKL